MVTNNQNDGFSATVKYLTVENIASENIYLAQHYSAYTAPSKCSVCFSSTTAPCDVSCSLPMCSRKYHKSCLFETTVSRIDTRQSLRITCKNFKCFHCSICMCGHLFGFYQRHCFKCGFQKCGDCLGLFMNYAR